MLYPPDVKLIQVLKKAQIYPNYYVAINFDTKQAYTIQWPDHTGVENAFKCSEGIPIRLSDADLEVSLTYLMDQGYIKKPSSGPVYQVTRSGWYDRYVRRREIISLIVTHVLFPSIVALITTLLTLAAAVH